MTHTCLIVIDMLNDFLDRWTDAERGQLIQHINELAGLCRSKGMPIIWVRQEFEENLEDAFLEMRDKDISVTIAGTRGAQIHAGIERRDTEPVIVKKRYSAFFNTNLDELLKDLGVGRVILAGVNTHACIRMAAIDAYQRDLRVIIADQCTDSVDPEHAAVSLNYMRDKIAVVMSNDEIERSVS
jgi:nicotinamidase-related amidase